MLCILNVYFFLYEIFDAIGIIPWNVNNNTQQANQFQKVYAIVKLNNVFNAHIVAKGIDKITEIATEIRTTTKMTPKASTVVFI